jgi:dihydrofolate synthase/folylpolyglutamate synthase
MLSGRSAHASADPAEALELARRLTGPDGLICVTGSLFLAAEARAVVLGLEPAAMVGGAVR